MLVITDSGTTGDETDSIVGKSNYLISDLAVLYPCVPTDSTAVF